MENKGMVPVESIEISKIKPLVLEEKKEAESSPKASSHAASTDSQGAVGQVTSSSEEQSPSGTSSDVETVIAADISERPSPDIPTTVTDTGSPPSSGTEHEIRVVNQRLCDTTMKFLIWQIILLGIPISEAYVAFTFWEDCDSGKLLPRFLAITALFTSLALLARISINITRKLERFNERSKSACFYTFVIDLFTISIYLVLMGYISFVDYRRCNLVLFIYTCCVVGIGYGGIPFMICTQRTKYFCCLQAIKEFGTFEQ